MSYRKKIAVVVTTFFPGSHASTLVTKLIEGFNYQGKIIKPEIDVASIYLDQIHIEDLGIALAKKHKIKTVLLSGGVAANTELRKQLKQEIKKEIPNAKYQMPAINFCTDNGAMIAITASYKKRPAFKQSWFKIQTDANLQLSQKIS